MFLNYSYKAYLTNINNKIILYIKEGLGIRSMARILKVSTITWLKRIIKIAKLIELSKIKNQSSYEVDELCTFYNIVANIFGLFMYLKKKRTVL